MTTDDDATSKGFRFWAPLLAACMALFIVVVDSTMMNVAVPTIVKDLKTNVSTVQGIISLYSLVMASLMLVGGKLGALKGIKKIFLVGVVIYGIGTLVAAFSPNVTVLALGWSVLEGIGAAMILPLAFALIVTNYGPREAAIGFGILGGVQASAAAVGPLLGGILTSYLSWRVGFAGEALIALAIFPLAPYIKERVTADEGTTLDWTGALLSVVGLFTIVLGLILAGRFGWWEAKRPVTIGDQTLDLFGLSPTPYLVGFGLVFLTGFLHWQLRREQRDETPLVRTRILGNERFLAGISSNVFQSMVITGLLFVLPLFLQSGAGYSAFESGLAIVPFSLATFAVSLGTSTWSERISPKTLIQAGIALMVVGIAWLYFVIGLEITIGQMILPLGIFGIGMGLLMAHLVNLILSSVDRDDSPEASGVNNVADQLGNSLGTAVVGSLLLTFFLGNMVDDISRAAGVQLSPQERTETVTMLEDAREIITEEEWAEAQASMPAEAREGLNQLADASVTEAMKDTLLVILGLLFVLALVSTFLPRREDEIPPEDRVPIADADFHHV